MIGTFEVLDEFLEFLAQPARVVERFGRAQQTEHDTDDGCLDARFQQRIPADHSERHVGNE